MANYSVNTRPLLQGSASESDEDQENSIIVAQDRKPLFKLDEPVDRYYVAYLLFYMLGVTTLIPWNFFINADEYWMYKFRDVHVKNPIEKTELQIMFASYLSVASSVPSTVFLVLNTFLSRRISLQVRMNGSMSVILMLFIATTVFVNINTDKWQEEFFVITMIIVVVLNTFSAILCGGLFGVVGKFPSTYIAAVVSGQALGGIFAALIEIISLTFAVSAITSAFIYFMVANITLLFSIIAYVVLSKSLFFKYHTIDKVAQAELEASSSCVVYGNISYMVIFKKIWLHGFSIFALFVISMSVYPGVIALIESQDAGNGNKWNDIYFVPVVNFLLYSCGDYFGRLIAGAIEWPTNGYLLALLNILRLGFLPILMLCNAQPRQNLPVLITSDLYYMIIISFFSLTNGYLANITVMSAPKLVEPHEREVASSMIAAFLGIGIAVGSSISLLMVDLL